ncbi:GMP/IMP nucleotidase [Gallaecimonas xiamenensis]|uniref:HAD-superfamily hydrolase n=1 Tax=Gallaecimonas xiamenensis 3-C-1 TaxID=745411 RepID=K2JQI8_9GAMM|nr:GMP/IMP nucleotidase [Gallaecimonas xiamenensis]EKE77568.1 HAD-superfamily hydrolase [Gallaecimonas xiamenensis 3-C-1]
MLDDQRLNWSEIDTVLLDMDGTLLDLHFDNHFWMDRVPVLLAEKDGISLDQARARIDAEYQAVFGTLNWYCYDYWTARLGLDIDLASREIQHLISLRSDTLPFLKALRESGRRVILLTNAHPKSLSLKVELTALDQHLDQLISTHSYRASKESQSLWQAVHLDLGFDPARTLFVDDSQPILEAARRFGIRYLLGVENPDSKKPHKQFDGFAATSDYRQHLDEIKKGPR